LPILKREKTEKARSLVIIQRKKFKKRMVKMNMVPGRNRVENNALRFLKQPHCKGERHLQCIILRWFLKHACRACDYSHVWEEMHEMCKKM
jgi:hypothetical protein